MRMVLSYIFGSVILVSILSIVGALPLLVTRNVPKKALLLLLSLSVGTLLGSVFLHFIPETISHGYTLEIAMYVLIGFFAFFIIEKLVHNHHHQKLQEAHHHAYHLAPINLIGDAIHNFIDGLIIASSYLVSIPLGIAATVSVMVHEIPQEIADFGILLYAGLSKKKALAYNLIAAASAIVGATAGLLLISVSDAFSEFIIPFTAGAFIYIGASNLIPELHKEHGIKQAAIQLLAAAAGVAIMVALVMFSPEHA